MNRPALVTPEMRPRENGADAVGEPAGDQPVDGFTLGLHGAPLGGRDILGNAWQRLLDAVGQAALAEVESGDQPTMNDKIGIATDRRREVGVFSEIEAEVADVDRRVFGLTLRAQHHLVDEIGLRRARHSLENAVEQLWLDVALLGNLHVERGQELAQRLQLGERGLVMDAIKKRCAALLQRLGGGHVGLDHELFDQPVGGESLWRGDTVDGAVGFQQHLALGQIQIERPTRIAGGGQNVIGRPERLQ